MTIDTIRSGMPPRRSPSCDVGILLHLGIEGLEGVHEPGPAEVRFCVPAAGGGQASAKIGITKDGQNALGQRVGPRSYENRSVLGEYRAMSRNVGSYNRPSCRQVIEDLERQVAAVRARGDEHVRQRQVGRHLGAWLSVHDPERA